MFVLEKRAVSQAHHARGCRDSEQQQNNNMPCFPASTAAHLPQLLFLASSKSK
jgi:hypothetical protein